MREFLSCIQNMVLKGNLSVEQISEGLGCSEDGTPLKSPWTIYNEISPENKQAKLGAVTLLQLMMVCRDTTPLDVMAKKLGKCVVSLPGSPGAQKFCESTAYKMAVDAELATAAVLNEVQKAMKSDGIISKKELARIFDCVHEAHTTLSAITEGAKT